MILLASRHPDVGMHPDVWVCRVHKVGQFQMQETRVYSTHIALTFTQLVFHLDKITTDDGYLVPSYLKSLRAQNILTYSHPSKNVTLAYRPVLTITSRPFYVRGWSS